MLSNQTLFLVHPCQGTEEELDKTFFKSPRDTPNSPKNKSCYMLSELLIFPICTSQMLQMTPLKLLNADFSIKLNFEIRLRNNSYTKSGNQMDGTCHLKVTWRAIKLLSLDFCHYSASSHVCQECKQPWYINLARFSRSLMRAAFSNFANWERRAKSLNFPEPWILSI